MVGNVIEVETLLRQANGAPLVRRLIAPNPSPMTERGTNSYLIGWREPAVIDPGPDAAAHLGALAAVAAHGAERAAPMRIVVTHTHLDHSAGAAALAKRLNARAFAYGAHDDGRSELQRRVADQVSGIGGGEGADRRFSPDAKLADGEALAADTGEWRLEALHTPGHLSNHLCFALRDAVGRPAALFSGDLVMAWSTSLISPPDGDMGAFMASLERLAARLETPGADPVYLPGHGAPIEAPLARVRELLAHRRAREAQILDALEAGPRDADALVAELYRDVAPALHPMARRNVLAHLLDLWDRGVVAAQGGGFAPGAAFERAA